MNGSQSEFSRTGSQKVTDHMHRDPGSDDRAPGEVSAPDAVYAGSR